MKHLVVIILFLSTLGFADIANAKNSDGDYVVILHGIARSSSHMEDLAGHLKKQGYDIINLDYPSTDHKLEKLVEIIHREGGCKTYKR